MSSKIEQPPHIQQPDRTASHAWALMASNHTEWLRFVAPQMGIDTEKYILGEALSSMIGDDENNFVAPYNPKRIESVKIDVFILLDWEISLPELDLFHDHLVSVYQELESMDWVGQDNFENVRSIWITKVRDFMREQILQNATLQEAKAYNYEVHSQLMPYWREFLYGHQIGDSMES